MWLVLRACFSCLSSFARYLDQIRFADICIKPCWQESMYERQEFINEFKRTPESASIPMVTETCDGQNRQVAKLIEGQVGKWMKTVEYHVRIMMTHRLDRGLHPVLPNQQGVNYAKRLPELTSSAALETAQKAIQDGDAKHIDAVRAMGSASHEEETKRNESGAGANGASAGDSATASAPHLHPSAGVRTKLRRSFSDEGAETFGFNVSIEQKLHVEANAKAAAGAPAAAAGASGALVGEAKTKQDFYDGLATWRVLYKYLQSEEERLQFLNNKALKVPLQALEKSYAPVKACRLSAEMQLWEQVEAEITALKKSLGPITAYKPWSKVPNLKKTNDFHSAIVQVFKYDELKVRLPVDVVASFFVQALLQCIDASSAGGQEIRHTNSPFAKRHLLMVSPCSKWGSLESFSLYQQKYAVIALRGTLTLGAVLTGDHAKRTAPVVKALDWMLQEAAAGADGFVTITDPWRGEICLKQDVFYVRSIVQATPVPGDTALCKPLAWYDANRGGLLLAEDLCQDGFGKRCVEHAKEVNKGLNKKEEALQAL